MTVLLCHLLLLSPAFTDRAQRQVYEGTWLTTNRKLDGTLTCIVTRLPGDRWQGRFFGTWQGVDFSYDVEFSGPPEKLHGTARIDGADYAWTGSISPAGSFQGRFGGTRYAGSFALQRRHD